MVQDNAIEARDEFRSEYELTLAGWLQRRFTYFCVALVALEATVTAFILLSVLRGGSLFAASMVESTGSRLAAAMSLIVPPIALIISAWFLWGLRPRLHTREEVLSAAGKLILLIGFLYLILYTVIRWQDPQQGTSSLFQLLFLHFAASLFLPWTPRESIRPMIPLIVAWAIIEIVLAVRTNPEQTFLLLVISPLILVPGLLVSAFRLRQWSSRFQSEMFRRGFLGMRREISQASAIHESLFPEQLLDSSFAFEFFYQPMRILGGDFIHSSRGPNQRLRVLLLDVTGHGLAAAMTVTRLYGEVERIIAESPGIAPGSLMAILNRYVHLTLATHSIYATGFVADIDPTSGTLKYASAGHPPAFLIDHAGTVSELRSTGMLLGAEDSTNFICIEESQQVPPHSDVIMYTDGAFETRGANGERLGLDRFKELLYRNPPPKHWPRYLGRLVTGHFAVAPDDDILLASISYLGPPSETNAPATETGT